VAALADTPHQAWTDGEHSFALAEDSRNETKAFEKDANSGYWMNSYVGWLDAEKDNKLLAAQMRNLDDSCLGGWYTQWRRSRTEFIPFAGAEKRHEFPCTRPLSLSVSPVTEVTRILLAIEQGDPLAAEQLLPLVYDELRKLAARNLAHEKPGQTLQPTALVHEAYLRLVGDREEPQWNGRGHFFAAAADVMRHILVDNARRKRRAKHGGGRQRVPLEDAVPAPQRRRTTCWPLTRR
jgi:hypothetical protein